MTGQGPDSGNGRCFVYQWNGVDEYEELVALRDTLRGDDQQYFGASCVISQDSSVVVVGAVDLFEDTLAHHAQAFVFSGPSYSIMTELVPTFPAPQGAADPRAEYGHFIDVSVDGTLIVVTAPFYGTGDIILNPNGVVFIFKWTGSTWEQTQAIECPIADADGTNFFGWTAQFSEDNSKLAVVSRRTWSAGGVLYLDRCNDLLFPETSLFLFSQAMALPMGVSTFSSVLTLTATMRLCKRWLLIPRSRIRG